MRARLASIGPAAMRGAALFLAAFTLIGLVGELRGRTLDVSLWWIDLRDLPIPVRVLLLAMSSGLLAAWAIRPSAGRRRRLTTAVACAVLAAFAIRDVVRFYVVLGAFPCRCSSRCCSPGSPSRSCVHDGGERPARPVT